MWTAVRVLVCWDGHFELGSTEFAVARPQGRHEASQWASARTQSHRRACVVLDALLPYLAISRSAECSRSQMLGASGAPRTISCASSRARHCSRPPRKSRRRRTRRGQPPQRCTALSTILAGVPVAAGKTSASALPPGIIAIRFMQFASIGQHSLCQVSSWRVLAAVGKKGELQAGHVRALEIFVVDQARRCPRRPPITRAALLSRPGRRCQAGHYQGRGRHSTPP